MREGGNRTVHEVGILLQCMYCIHASVPMTELILRRDSRLDGLLNKFEHKRSGDSSFLEMLHDLISKLLSCHCM